MSDALHSMDMAFSFLSDLFRGIWQWVVDSPIVFLSLLAFLFVVVLGWLITLVQLPSRFDVYAWSDTGIIGVFKRYREEREKRKKEAFANRIFGQVENLDVQWVDIDGQRFYRPHRSRRYKVRLGERSATYYRPDGDYVPVYDGKKQVRKKE